MILSNSDKRMHILINLEAIHMCIGMIMIVGFIIQIYLYFSDYHMSFSMQNILFAYAVVVLTYTTSYVHFQAVVCLYLHTLCTQSPLKIVDSYKQMYLVSLTKQRFLTRSMEVWVQGLQAVVSWKEITFVSLHLEGQEKWDFDEKE
jgi:hypothetical protein